MKTVLFSRFHHDDLVGVEPLLAWRVVSCNDSAERAGFAEKFKVAGRNAD